jgi:RNA polymerase sigma-70 factor (ECF subfamily)
MLGSVFEADDAVQETMVRAWRGLDGFEGRSAVPPYDFWLRGPVEMGRWFLGQGCGCRGSRLVATAASGCAGFGSYRPDPHGGHAPFASADDVAQEVCLAVLKALSSFRDQGRPFLAFVFGIAAHKVADAHRAAARNRSDPVPDVPDEAVQVDGPEQRVLQAELAGRMGRLLDTLPDKQRNIIVLRVVVGLSAEETAEVVGLTSGAVRVAQHRALTRLRNVLASQEMV